MRIEAQGLVETRTLGAADRACRHIRACVRTAWGVCGMPAWTEAAAASYT